MTKQGHYGHFTEVQTQEKVQRVIALKVDKAPSEDRRENGRKQQKKAK